MRSPNYYRVRKLVRVAFWLALIGVVWFIATHIWWAGGGWCVGNMEVCGL